MFLSQENHGYYPNSSHVSYIFYQDNVTVSEGANGQDIRARYELSYNTVSGILITTCVVDGTDCSNGRCHHELQNNTADSRCQPPVSQFSGEDVTVSVTARNIVGRSNSSVSRSIGEFSEPQLLFLKMKLIMSCCY